MKSLIIYGLASIGKTSSDRSLSGTHFSGSRQLQEVDPTCYAVGSDPSEAAAVGVITRDSGAHLLIEMLNPDQGVNNELRVKDNSDERVCEVRSVYSLDTPPQLSIGFRDGFIEKLPDFRYQNLAMTNPETGRVILNIAPDGFVITNYDSILKIGLKFYDDKGAIYLESSLDGVVHCPLEGLFTAQVISGMVEVKFNDGEQHNVDDAPYFEKQFKNETNCTPIRTKLLTEAIEENLVVSNTPHLRGGH